MMVEDILERVGPDGLVDGLFGFEVALHYMKQGHRARRRGARMEYFVDGSDFFFVLSNGEARPSVAFVDGDILGTDWEVRLIEGSSVDGVAY